MGIFGASYRGLCKKGVEALESGNQAKAEQLILQAINMDPSAAMAYACLGMVYLMASGAFRLRNDKAGAKGYGDASIAAYDEAIRRETSSQRKAALWWQRGIVLRSIERDDEGFSSWLEAEKLSPGYTTTRSDRIPESISEAMTELKT